MAIVFIFAVSNHHSLELMTIDRLRNLEPYPQRPGLTQTRAHVRRRMFFGCDLLDHKDGCVLVYSVSYTAATLVQFKRNESTYRPNSTSKEGVLTVKCSRLGIFIPVFYLDFIKLI